MNASGRARIETEVIDLSVLVDTGLKGITAVLGFTERGPVGKTILVGSWNEYVRHFGGLLSESKFPLLCKRALERGGKLRIGRVAHYEEIDDISTLVGAVAEADAHGFAVEATSFGTWGNDLTITLLKSNTDNKVDCKVSLAGYPDLDQTITELSQEITIEDINRFNASCNFIKVRPSSVGANLQGLIDNDDAVHQLSHGTQALFDDYISNDYMGDSTTMTGIHIFDNDTDFTRIAVPEMSRKDIDFALVDYAEMRKDCRAILRSRTGIDGLAALKYRQNDLNAINSWYASMVYGGIEVTNPRDGGQVTIPAIADVLGCMGQKDNTAYEWFATAGSKRGRLKNVLGVEYNLGASAKATEFDQVVNGGINSVIDDRDFGPVYWGNRTMWKGNTLLRYENVADLLIFLTRAISPLIKTELFDPNDIETWKTIHRNVRPLLELVKNRRGIWNYLYQGDQLIDNISQAQVNTSNDIDSGKYTFYLWIQPKVGLEYVGVKIIVTNSGVSFEELTGQPQGII